MYARARRRGPEAKRLYALGRPATVATKLSATLPTFGVNFAPWELAPRDTKIWIVLPESGLVFTPGIRA